MPVKRRTKRVSSVRYDRVDNSMPGVTLKIIDNGVSKFDLNPSFTRAGNDAWLKGREEYLRNRGR